MNEVQFTYHFEGQMMPVSEAIKRIIEEASKKSPATAEAFLDYHSKLLNYTISMSEIKFKHEIKKDNRKDIMQTIVYPIIGVVGLVSMIFLVLKNPFPSYFQSNVLWVVLSLLSAAFGALIPGFVKWKHKNGLRAGGGIAIFLIMMIWVKPDMKTTQDTFLKGVMYVAKQDSLTIDRIPITLDQNSDLKVCDFANKQLMTFYGSNEIDTFTCYRKSDGLIYQNEICRGLTEGDIIMISNKVQTYYKGKRDAYNRLVSSIQ